VRDRVRLTRYGLDCTAYMLLAAGHVDLVIEAGLQPYDVQALMPIIETAGGVITTWDGRDPQQGGRILAAGSAALHKEAMTLLAG
jgi:fructose-1,6-bisphosphatase/inositol monophosphatase family enzyme